MSLEALKEYGRRCVTDPALGQKAKEIGLTNVQGQIEHARSLGLDWGPEDMTALAREAAPEQELSEEQLESVAGGFVTTTVASVVAIAVVVGGAAAGVGTAVTSAGQTHW